MQEKLKHFKWYSKKLILERTRLRRFETKWGERVHVPFDTHTLESLIADPSVKYVLFGISENVGVLANEGVGGTATAWGAFIDSLLNIQSNDFLSGDETLLLGYFDFEDVYQLIRQNALNKEERIDAYRHAVVAIDEEVEHLVQMIASNGKMPVVVGGGHNNAYPLMKGAAKGLHKAGLIPIAQINCINLDAHTDYRPAEGRHSGNAFRYAEEDGYLQKYCALGVHENYLPQNIWMDIVNNPFMDVITYEDIFILEKRNFMQSVLHAIGFTEDNFTGIELDMDCIEGVLSSAETPSGIAVSNARQYLSMAGLHAKAAYLHICEGVCVSENGRTDPMVGKLISYLVSDFMKAHSSAH